MLRRKRSVSFGGFGWIDKSSISALRARKQELLAASNGPDGDCPPSPPRTAPPTTKSAHFFDMMDKMEDDYIPYPRIEEVLEKGGPYPQVILPQFGGYWIEDPGEPPPPTLPSTSKEEERGSEAPGADCGYRLEETNEAARAYRKYFLGKEHLNFSCSSSSVGNLLLSVRHEEENQQEHLHVIIRSRVKTIYQRLSVSELPDIPSVQELAKLLCDDAASLRFSPVLYPKASQLIVNYDEHEVNSTFKFGVIFQRFGQSCFRTVMVLDLVGYDCKMGDREEEGESFQLHWGHQVGTLLHQHFNDTPTTPSEGSSATPGVPATDWLSLLLLRGL